MSETREVGWYWTTRRVDPDVRFPYYWEDGEVDRRCIRGSHIPAPEELATQQATIAAQGEQNRNLLTLTQQQAEEIHRLSVPLKALESSEQAEIAQLRTAYDERGLALGAITTQVDSMMQGSDHESVVAAVKQLRAGRDAVREELALQERTVGILNAQIESVRVHKLEVWLCPVHESLDLRGALRPLDNCIACLRVERDELQSERDLALRENNRLSKLLNTPEIEEFDRAIPIEAAHQVERWSSDHDAGKNPADWFWLIGYLAGKALHAQMAGDVEKAKHHCISTAAALRNWHAHLRSGISAMRPGISEDAARAQAGTEGS